MISSFAILPMPDICTAEGALQVPLANFAITNPVPYRPNE